MVSKYFETYNGERTFAFFSAVSKCEDISLTPQSTTSSTISQKLWLCAQFFKIIKNVILKKYFKINYFDACFHQTVKMHYMPFAWHWHFYWTLWWFEFKWSENLTEKCSPNFPGLSTRALSYALSFFTKPPILNRGEIKIWKTYFIWYQFGLITFLYIRGCGRLSFAEW